MIHIFIGDISAYTNAPGVAYHCVLGYAHTDALLKIC